MRVLLTLALARLRPPPIMPHHMPSQVTMTIQAAAVAPPSELQDAIGEKRAAEVWALRPPGALPNGRRQAALISWLCLGPLAAHQPQELLHKCLMREPKLFARASSLPALRESHATLALLLREDLSPKRVAHAVAHDPALLLTPAPELLAAAEALAAATGLPEEMLQNVLRAEPALLLCSSESIGRRLSWLHDRLGIEPGGRLTRVISRAPLVLRMSLSSLEARVACLVDLGVPKDVIGTVIVRSPRLVHSPLTLIREKARWLDEAGVLLATSELTLSSAGTAEEAECSALGAFVCRQPDFWSMSTRHCEETRGWLLSLGLNEPQAASAIALEPAVLSMSKEQLQLRASFFLHVLRGSPAELASVPHMLTSDLAKVPMLRHAYCLTQGITARPTDLLVKGDTEFCTQVARCTLGDLNEFEAEGKHLTFFQGAGM